MNIFVIRAQLNQPNFFYNVDLGHQSEGGQGVDPDPQSGEDPGGQGLI